jgi:hypothetical protein
MNYQAYPAYFRYRDSEAMVLLTAIEHPPGTIKMRAELIIDDGTVVLAWDAMAGLMTTIHEIADGIGEMMRQEGERWLDQRWADLYLEDDPAYFVLEDGQVLHLPFLVEDFYQHEVSMDLRTLP